MSHDLQEIASVLAKELASWRMAPHRSDVLESYWSDIPEKQKYAIRFGSEVNANSVAKELVAKFIKEATNGKD